ncbi:MAG: cobalamin-dependent protein [Bacteroidales bacterium]|nr:cobalamin-dependent protein [Bacteroidales bacterium]
MTFSASTGKRKERNVVVIATVKGDVHDIGKNILGIVMTCNGFEVHDLGVMVDKETILAEAQKLDADLIAVSGLITPSLYQMEELCREMTARKLNTPLLIGGATTSALHTAVKLAPLYNHVFYGPDASASAVLAKRCMMDREKFENEMHAEQQKIRDIYHKKNMNESQASENNNGSTPDNVKDINTATEMKGFNPETYITSCPQDIPTQEIPAEEVMPYFDWKMFYAIWGVKYGSAVPEAAELMQLRRDAEEEIKFGDFKIMLAARFMNGYSENDDIVAKIHNEEIRLPMMRQETFKMQSLSDFVIAKESGKTSPFGAFAICVSKRSTAHEEGCSCPACNSRYEDMIGKTVRQTIAEAASRWLSVKVEEATKVKVVKPAAGYSSCPDHTLKKDILSLLGECTELHGHNCSCGCQGHKHSHSDDHKFTSPGLGIKMTESYAMTPDACICGLIFIHPEASYPEIRTISQEQYESYRERRGMDQETARRFLGYLLK